MTSGSLAGARALWRTNERLRFLVVGGWNTLFGYVCFVALYTWLHERLYYLVIGLLAHAIATVNAFVAHRLLVFRSDGPWLPDFLRFNISLAVLMGYGLGMLWLLVGLFHMNPIAAQGIVTISGVAISYVAHRYFSFRIRR